MAKKIKFALEMADGVQVRTIEELRDNFDQGKAMEYFVNGKLLEWLEDRYYDEEAEAISEIGENAPNAAQKICKALGVEYEDDGNDMEDAINVAEKTAKLKKVTNDEAILKNAAYTAFDQEDLADLLDAGVKTIYLYGDVFSVPVKRMSDVKIVGILDSEPKIKLPNGCTIELLTDKKIEFENVLLPKGLEMGKKSNKKISHDEKNNTIPSKMIKKAIYAGMKLMNWEAMLFEGKDFDIEQSFFSVSNARPHPLLDEDLDGALFFICSGKYNKEDVFFMIIAEDYSSGLAFTDDAICIISDDNGNRYDPLSTILRLSNITYEKPPKDIIKYRDLKKVVGGYNVIRINDKEYTFDSLEVIDIIEPIKRALSNICNIMDIHVEFTEQYE